jgi:hypothetical protein
MMNNTETQRVFRRTSVLDTTAAETVCFARDGRRKGWDRLRSG